MKNSRTYIFPKIIPKTSTNKPPASTIFHNSDHCIMHSAGLLTATGRARESRGLWWLGQKGAFGGDLGSGDLGGGLGRSSEHLQSSGDALQHQQKEATLGELKRQQKNSVKSVANSKNVNCLARCHDVKEYRPTISDRNNERESPDSAKANKKYSNTANISQKERGSRGPSNVGRPLPITQGLKLKQTQETKKARFSPLLATGLAPPPIEDVYLDQTIETESVSREPSSSSTSTSSATLQQQNDGSSGPGLPNTALSSSPHPQSRKEEESESENRKKTTSQLQPRPATQRPYISCPSAMLCIPKVSLSN